MARLFGTDGVRGIANKELTCELAFKLGCAACEALKKNTEQSPKFLIGMDTRISGDMLKNSISAGIMSRGGNVIDVGIFPTPGIAFAVRHYKASAGIVISASHNPFYDNGIKFFDSEGKKLSDTTEDNIQNILENELIFNDVINEKIGKHEYYDANGAYMEYLLSKLAPFSLSGKKIVLDCANGASYFIAPELFKHLNATVIAIHNKPNGTNINDNCGSTHLRSLQKEVVKNKADFGLAFDGDADRLLAVDEKGNEVNGDMIMYLFALYLQQNKMLKKDTLVITVMSNIGLKKALAENNICVSETAVGDRYILQRMESDSFNLGGEQSGHIICSLLNTTGDGLASALLLSKLLTEAQRPFSELFKSYVNYPQILVNVKTAADKKLFYIDNEKVMAKKIELEEKYSGIGKILLRHSGTEPLVRVMIEGNDEEQIKTDAHELADIIQEISK